MEYDGFDWDDGNRGKCAKHGVPSGEIEFLYGHDPAVGPDAAHSMEEQRFRAVGRSSSGRFIFVVFTWRRRGTTLLIPPISARSMHRREVASFEESLS